MKSEGLSQQEGLSAVKFKLGVLAILAIASSPANTHGGDRFEGYFWIVGSEKAPPAKSLSNYEFLKEVERISEQYSKTCGEDVAVWHSDLMTGLTPGLWVAYTVFEDTKSKAMQRVPNDSCSKLGYLKGGDLVFPTLLEVCAANLDQCAKDH